jgi:hypothetical protein
VQRGTRRAAIRNDGLKRSFLALPGAKRIHSPKSSTLKQNSLIFDCCIDYSPRHGEINHPILFGWIAGFAMVLVRIWQLAPLKNAKAPRNVFVGSSTMEMDQ